MTDQITLSPAPSDGVNTIPGFPNGATSSARDNLSSTARRAPVCNDSSRFEVPSQMCRARVDMCLWWDEARANLKTPKVNPKAERPYAAVLLGRQEAGEALTGLVLWALNLRTSSVGRNVWLPAIGLESNPLLLQGDSGAPLLATPRNLLSRGGLKVAT